MPPTFWNNTAPYLMLFTTSVVTLTLAIKRSRSRRFILAFTAAALDFLFYAESVLVIGLNAYVYRPGLSPDQFQDTFYGNLFSQFSIVTTAALLIVYGLPYAFYLVAGAVYFVIDVLFAGLGIYEHINYRSVYTLIGFPPLLIFLKFWYQKLAASSKKLLRWVTLLFGSNAVMSLLYTLPLMLTGIQVFSIQFTDSASKNHSITNVIYGLVVPAAMIAVVKAKLHWSLKAVSLAGVFLFKYTLSAAGIITIRSGWFVPVTLFEIAARYFLIALFDRFLERKPAALGA